MSTVARATGASVVALLGTIGWAARYGCQDRGRCYLERQHAGQVRPACRSSRVPCAIIEDEGWLEAQMFENVS
jgi:hypothetical protein